MASDLRGARGGGAGLAGVVKASGQPGLHMKTWDERIRRGAPQIRPGSRTAAQLSSRKIANHGSSNRTGAEMSSPPLSGNTMVVVEAVVTEVEIGFVEDGIL